MQIGYAKVSDADDIAKNTVLLAKESENENINYDKAFDGVRSVISDKSKGFFIVAKENDFIIGQLMITYEWSDWNNKNMWWIQSVYVDKSFRRKGVFSKLFEYVKRLADKNNVDVIRLYVYNKNNSAIKTYERLDMVNKPYKIYQISLG